MYQDTIDQFAETAARKVKVIADNPLGFFIAAMMAGAYIGLGIIAIFSIGQGLDPVGPLAGHGPDFRHRADAGGVRRRRAVHRPHHADDPRRWCAAR